MNFEELFKKLEEEDVPAPSDDELNKMAHQLLTESVNSDNEPDQGMVKKIASAVLGELKRAGVIKQSADMNAAIESNENSPNPAMSNPVDAPPAEVEPNAALQTGVAQAMATPDPGVVAATAASPAAAAATAAEVTIQDPDEAELVQKELEVINDTASRLIQDGITDDPVAALAAASLAVVEDSLATEESAEEAAYDASEGIEEDLIDNAVQEKLSEIIESYGRVSARDLVRAYLRENLFD